MSKATDLLKAIVETGEMSAKDLEPGGEFHDAKLELENICKEAGLKCEVRPFDKYQGPFAAIDGGGKVWLLPDGEDEKFFFQKGGKGHGFNDAEELKKLAAEMKEAGGPGPEDAPDEDELADMSFEELKDKAGVKEDGIGVLNLYMQKYFPEASGPEDLASALDDFRSDVEQYAMDAVSDMENFLNKLGGPEDK
jgi:hypothetical protein